MRIFHAWIDPLIKTYLSPIQAFFLASRDCGGGGGGGNDPWPPPLYRIE